MATYIYSQNNSLENLLTNLYEGGVYLARNNFDVTKIFNFEKSNEPYPSRYIKQVSSNKATLYLKINNARAHESNYFRIELRDESFNLIAMSEPIFFKNVS